MLIFFVNIRFYFKINEKFISTQRELKSNKLTQNEKIQI